MLFSVASPNSQRREMPKGKTIHRKQYPYFLELLLEVRKKAGITQAALGEAASLSQPYVSQVEAGTLRLDTVQLRDWLHACGSNLGKFGRELEKRLKAAGL
jgi:transcriptional regulator with XRE-family HTH domain